MAIKNENSYTYHIQHDRGRKNLAILELIRKKGPISRADISRILGYNIVTISNYIDFYINKRIILEVGLDISSGGRRPELVELNAKCAYIAGVDVGPNVIQATITDLKVNVIHKTKRPRSAMSMEDLAAEVVEIIADAIKNSKISPSSIKNIGIGISGIVDYNSGTIRDTDPTRGRTKVSFLKFAKTIEREFNIPAYIGNDASCAAFGEKILNPATDVENLLYIYSDVGCGIIIHGEVYSGSSGCAGETQLVFDTLQRNEKNYLKEYTFMRPWGVDLGLILEAKKAIEKGISTEIINLAKAKNPEDINIDAVIEAATKKKDKLAIELINNAGKNLGIRVAYLVNFINPDVVVIGGGIERAGDYLLEPVKESVRRFAFEEASSIVKIIPSFLGEDAVILGAAALAAREIFIQA